MPVLSSVSVSTGRMYQKKVTSRPRRVVLIMEKNDFSRWPNGIFARAYIRDYAKIIGVDPDTTVDEFCRWFPQGDRRADRQMLEHAELLDHKPNLKNEVPANVGEDRRWSADKAAQEAAERAATTPAASQPGVFGRLRRALNRA